MRGGGKETKGSSEPQVGLHTLGGGPAATSPSRVPRAAPEAVPGQKAGVEGRPSWTLGDLADLQGGADSCTVFAIEPLARSPQDARVARVGGRTPAALGNLDNG